MILVILCAGIIKKVPVYEEFVEGEVIKVTDTAESQDSSTDSSSKREQLY